MPNVTTRPSGADALGDLLVLTDEAANSSVSLAPRRGAIVTSFRVGDRELLYLEESTLTDPTKNVRGGVPVLFPSPGKLTNDTWSRDGRQGVMKQHGFARNLPWNVVESGAGGAATVTLSLVSNEVTLAQYPWEFRVELTFGLTGARLRVTSRVTNTGGSPMPFGLGFHPYFTVEDKAAAKIDTRATRVFDNVTKTVMPFSGFDLTAQEVDLHLLDHGSTESALHLGDGTRLCVRGSPDFTRWVVWTLAGKDFVCLEPWTCPGNALGTGEGLIVTPPGQTHESFIEMAFVA